MKHFLQSAGNFLICIQYQIRNSLTAYHSFSLLNATGFKGTPAKKGKQTLTIYRIAYVFVAFAFLFLVTMQYCLGQLSLSRSSAPVLTGNTSAIQFYYALPGKTIRVPNAAGVACTNPVTANAGPSDTSVCVNQTLHLNGVAGGDYTTVAWTTTGDGTFTPDTFSLNVVYHPGAFDLQDMAFTLTFKANADAPCIAASDQINVHLLALPVTVTTSNSPVCEGSALDLGAGGGNSFLWSGPNGYSGYSMDTTIFPVTLNQSGTYYVTITNADGCSKQDSAIVLINPVSGSIGSPIAACDSATLPWGETVTVTDDYSTVYTAFNGCDSTVTIHVTIKYSSIIDTTVAACDSFNWYGIEYTSSGNIVHMIPGGNSQGCDSSIVLHLTINRINDGNACTTDVCNTSAGTVTHTPIPVDDGNACTTDACNTSTGIVTHTNAADDGFACSIDACNTLTGQISHDYSACTPVVNVKAFIQGYYWEDGKMKPVMFNQGVPVATEGQVDSVMIELHDTVNFSVIADQYKGVIDTGGNVTGSLSIASIGTRYYLAFRHRNSVLTCSANPVLLNVVSSYDFTSNQDSTYGGNVTLDSYGIGKWLIYSGDVSIPFQDGYVGTDDVTNVDNDNLVGMYFDNATYFMLVTDISGDGYVGTDDVTLTNNNNLYLVSSLHP